MHGLFKRKLEDIRSKEGINGIAKSRIKKLKTLRKIQGELYRIKPLAVWFKNSYSCKLVLFHTKDHEEEPLRIRLRQRRRVKRWRTQRNWQPNTHKTITRRRQRNTIIVNTRTIRRQDRST